MKEVTYELKKALMGLRIVLRGMCLLDEHIVEQYAYEKG